MKFSEISEQLKNSKTAETMLDTKRFFQKHRFLIYPFIVIIVVLSIAITPFIYKYFVTLSEQDETEADSNQFSHSVTVYITGEVNNPGVYTLTNDDRVKDAIEAAGGLKETAFVEYVNLAQRLYDEQHINIPSANEQTKSNKTSSKVYTGIININTATVDDFCQLPGIGETIASRIVEYRNNVGNFVDIRDIMNVKGVSETLFNKIRYNLSL